MIKEYEIVPHTADLKIHAFGTTFEELFRNALRGMFSAVKPQGAFVKYEENVPQVSTFSSTRTLVTRSNDIEMLLIDFLSDCLYLSDTHKEAYFDVRFNSFSTTEVDAILYGITITGYEVVEIKAVTYHDLHLEQIDGIWRATIVFDV